MENIDDAGFISSNWSELVFGTKVDRLLLVSFISYHRQNFSQLK